MQAILALEDGRIFSGRGHGAKGECYGEVVFNTSITGYQEIFTDPSYAGQIVILTNPQIGNYGTSTEDNEADRPYIEGLVVREFSPIASNWRSDAAANTFLAKAGIPIASGLDTRALVRHLVQVGCRVTVVPSLTSAEDVLALNPDGVFLSNGPGDPEPLQAQVANIRKLIGKKPIFGICLGNQLLGLAVGGKTYKLKFGHRGANHPVRNEITKRVEITSHNHGFAVDPDSLNMNDVEITHVNLNDQTLEGFRHRSEPVFCVQYHPEAAPGPHDSHYLFSDFTKMMRDAK